MRVKLDTRQKDTVENLLNLKGTLYDIFGGSLYNSDVKLYEKKRNIGRVVSPAIWLYGKPLSLHTRKMQTILGKMIGLC